MRGAFGLALAGVFGGSGIAEAHEFSPHVLTLEEKVEGEYAVWSRWAKGVPSPTIVVSDACRLSAAVLSCRDSDFSLHFEGLTPTGAGLVARVVRLDGEVFESFVTAEAPFLAVSSGAHTLEGAEGQGAGFVYDARLVRFVRFFRLGAEHVWAGLDHLLFLLALTILVVDGRRLAIAVSAFTVGHSLTLALALFVWSPPSAPVEAAIALSVVLLARDVLLKRKINFAWPAFGMAAFFGLIHGVGFAGALQDIGLAAEARLESLMAFNLGVEIGQLAFVAVVWGLLYFRPAKAFVPWVGYGTGIAGMTWLVARVSALGTGG